MSKAVICDKCGKVFDRSKIAPSGREPMLHPIWTSNPFLHDSPREEYAELHLCNEHYKEFEDEYLANLKETYGQDMG